MEMTVNNTIKKKILESNAEYHDFWADTHDTNVPYICRRSTRKYYWDLIESGIISSGNKVANAHVLEIGCGTGTFTDIFIRKGASSFTGIDLSDKMIKKAKIKAEGNNYKVPVTFLVSALETFALENQNKFDVIQSSSFIHHLSDIDEGLKCIKLMLKPGGVYIAIHEEINNVSKTRVERVDDQLQYLFGYAGSKLVSRNTRIKETLKFFINPIKLRIKRLFFRGKDNTKIQTDSAPVVREQSLENNNNINYVDFQLNDKFSLSAKCSQYGIIKPYCYLAFTELMVFGKPINFEMLIMEK